MIEIIPPVLYTTAYRTEWYRFPDGTVQSFRFHRDRYQEMRSAVIKRGGVRTQDPFRKGAPVGGYPLKESA